MRHHSLSLILSLSCAAAFASAAAAEGLRMTGSSPGAAAVIHTRSSGFFVRFDRPVDHLHARMTITANGKVVETLHPRDDSAADVLFARAPTLKAGYYALHWEVRAMDGADTVQGDIPFTVSQYPDPYAEAGASAQTTLAESRISA